MTTNITIESLDNGFILNAYSYGSADSFGYDEDAKQVRKYIKTMEEVTDEIKAFLGVDV